MNADDRTRPVDASAPRDDMGGLPAAETLSGAHGAPDVTEPAAPDWLRMPSGAEGVEFVERMGGGESVTVTVYRSQVDRRIVVEIDTNTRGDAIRVAVNDGYVIPDDYDGVLIPGDSREPLIPVK